jgi:OFA family oxalate/formate antiporter-like MFS transporter
MFVITGLMMFALTQVTTFVPFVVVLMLIGLCYGGIMGIFPSITADAFGAKNLGMNYGIIFTAFGVAAFVGPRLASHFKVMNNGDYTQAFLISASLSIAGIILTFIARSRKNKEAVAKMA